MNLLEVVIGFAVIAVGDLGLYYPYRNEIVLSHSLRGSYGYMQDYCVTKKGWPKTGRTSLENSPSLKIHERFPRPEDATYTCDNYNYVLSHEWAHAVWYMETRPALRSLYCKYYREEQYYPTWYSKTSCTENFAEVYANLLMGTIEGDRSYGQIRIAENAIKSRQNPNLRPKRQLYRKTYK